MSVARVLDFLSELRIPGVHGVRRFGDVMADFQRDRFAAIAPALMAVAAGERPPIGRHWWEATKGASKDSDLAAGLLWLMAFALRPLSIQIGAADQDQAAEMRKAAKDILQLNHWLAQRIEVQNWRLVCKATGVTAEIIASDVAGSHGSRPDVLIINELSHVTKQEFAENLRDNAAKVPHGLVVIATNAGFTGTWQFKWRELARTSSRWHFHAWSQPAPWLDVEEIEEAQRRNPQSRYLRLWQGVWCSGNGDALDPADIDAAFTLAGPTDRREQGYRYFGGLDIGWKHDNTGWAVIAKHLRTNRFKLVKLRNWAPNKVTGEVHLPDVEQAIADDHRHYHLSKCGFDPHQGALMSQLLKKRGVPIEEVPFTGSRLNDMASVVLETFRARTIDLFDDLLRTDLRRLVLEEKSYGFRLSSTKDADGHADRATALTIALVTARNSKAGRRLLVGMASPEDEPDRETEQVGDRETVIHLGEYGPGSLDKLRRMIF